ncbi:MAG: c-type cytochrome [Chloroflexota bacterium]
MLGSATLLRFGSILGMLGVISLGISLTQPKPVTAADDQVAFGRMVTRSVCMECHTQRVAGDPFTLDATKAFAGGEEFDGPWGTVYARNITQDKATGIGNWTDAEIKRAINEGIAKDGTKLLVMPWEFFRGMSDDDLNAVVAYLKTVPAVSNTLPPAKLAPPEAVAGFIGSIPPLKAVAPEALFARPRDVFHDFVFGGDPKAPKAAAPGFKAPQGKDSPARGEYLAKTAFACVACHNADFAGGTPPFFAANITPDKQFGIGNWSKEMIVRALREGIDDEGKRLSPVMPSAGLAYGVLDNDEAYNIIAFLQSLPAVARPGGAPQRPPAAPAPAVPLAPAVPAALPNTGDAQLPLLAAVAVLAGTGALGSGLWMRRRRA